ncbi:MAG: C1 family peptidase [Deinococcales bacterium]
MDERILGGMGWTRDLPDVRDYQLDTPEVEAVLAGSAPLEKARKRVPARIDLREDCSPIEDQGALGSCTANAGVGLLEYFERRAFGKHLDGSRLFLYKATRNLLGWKGDQGAYLRSTMKAMVLFGVPPEEIRPYRVETFDEEPPAFCYAFAQNYKAIRYYRLDPAGTPGAEVLRAVKRNLAAGLPSMFGFTVYSSMPGIGEGSGDIPYPQPGEAVKGGHAVVAVGYDDTRTVGEEEGALLIRNSWGVGWGEKGYGWLPYRYVLEQVAVDFWSLVRADFIDTALFR